jgi:hypothetical protein
MTIPGFSAEVSIYQSTATYFTGSFGSSANGVAVVQPQLPKRFALKCSNTCPAGQILCECAKDCKCCIGGCRETVDGNCICDKTPARGGFRFFYGWHR